MRRAIIRSHDQKIYLHSFRGVVGYAFCIIDLAEAYLHIKLDDESAKIVALSIHRGTYLVHLLFYGLASVLFHAEMTLIFDNLEGVIAYFDDCLVYGKTKEECEYNLIKIFQQFEKHNIKVNKDK